MDYITELRAAEAAVECAKDALAAAKDSLSAVQTRICFSTRTNHAGRRVRDPRGHTYELSIACAEARTRDLGDGQDLFLNTYVSYQGHLIKKDGTMSTQYARFVDPFENDDDATLRPGWTFVEK